MIKLTSCLSIFGGSLSGTPASSATLFVLLYLSLLAIVLSVLLRIADSDYLFGVVQLFLLRLSNLMLPQPIIMIGFVKTVKALISSIKY